MNPREPVSDGRRRRPERAEPRRHALHTETVHTETVHTETVHTETASRQAAAEVRLAALYESSVAVVYGFCRARVPQHDAEDVTAEVFRTAAEHLRRDPTAELTTGWAVTVARSRLIDLWRRQNRRRETLIAEGALTRGVRPVAENRWMSEPHDHGDDHSDDLVIRALDMVPTVQRFVLVAHHVDGWSCSEIADALGRSVTAVESLLARGRRNLTVALEQAQEHRRSEEHQECEP